MSATSANVLWLDRNQLTGELPLKLTNLSQLEVLSLLHMGIS